MKTIAYLSQEIPSLSATFVYGEILELKAHNINIIPISIKYPNLSESELEPVVKNLLTETSFIYQRPWIKLIQDNFILFFKNPSRYLTTLGTMLKDVINLGVFNAIALKLIYQFLHSSPVAKILLDQRCEHLHIHLAHVPTQIGMYAAAIAQIPFSFTAHANDLFERCYLIDQKTERAKFVVTISDYNYNFLKTKVKDINKIKVIHCGIDLNTYQFVEKTSFSETIIIKSLGRLVEKKGMDTLILAAQELRKRKINFIIELGGTGELKNDLRELVNQYSLESHIIFAGAISHHQVSAWLQKADLFVLACKQDRHGDQDGIPVVLMEAMAMGIPVVSTTISGIPELIQDGVSGFLATPNDPMALTDKICQALNPKNDTLKITQLARATIVKSFNIKSTTTQLRSLFCSS
jgi:glycosyltransferase involved in cell wall biosynthesis